MAKYKCKGGQGCNHPGCEFVTTGKPDTGNSKPYICPMNHWRSAAFVEVEQTTDAASNG